MINVITDVDITNQCVKIPKDVAKDQGTLLNNKKMSKEFVAAMLSEAIGAATNRVLNKYMSSFFKVYTTM